MAYQVRASGGLELPGAWGW